MIQPGHIVTVRVPVRAGLMEPYRETGSSALKFRPVLAPLADGGEAAPEADEILPGRRLEVIRVESCTIVVSDVWCEHFFAVDESVLEPWEGGAA